jgi:hypothetical protein
MGASCVAERRSFELSRDLVPDGVPFDREESDS